MYLEQSEYRYTKPVKVIHAGEWYVSGKDELIYTILGSCVAVCLHDDETHISGMNHFMLPGRISKVDIFSDRTARYGITAMKELLQSLEKEGAVKSRLRAMIFGGGTMIEGLSPEGTSQDPIPEQNTRIARLVLEMEDIPLDRDDTGGMYARKLMLDVLSGRAFVGKTRSMKAFRHDETAISRVRAKRKNRS
jgi:chemotaxis protein CheD